MNLVIVESPHKAKTIEKFLGGDFKVMSSYGHIRDLKKHDFSIDLDDHFKPVYEIPSDKTELVSNLVKTAAKADMVWLASDEDREGEAISWHLYEVLGLKPERTKRIVFHEITKTALLYAIEHPREIDMDLVNAQQARRVLDRIVGFELSPILWRKVKPSLSAGRVQSVVVRLVVEREQEIQKFKSEASYRVTGTFAVPSASKDEGGVTIFNAEYSQRFKTREEAEAFLHEAVKATYTVSDVQQKPLHRQPAPPFTTSTLQQEATRKLHFSVSQTMSVAQHLYEAGHITYMRTDSVNLSTLCLGTSKEHILKTMGPEYQQTRNFTTHSKGAQEAHEAIRPTYIDTTSIEGTSNEQRLYELIWKRTLASQMADAIIEKTTVEITMDSKDQSNQGIFTVTGEVVKFDGYLKVYTESNDDDEETESGSRLPKLTKGMAISLSAADAVQRYTLHPQRYTEGTLVKKLEELGIGRPSTYATTISTIQERDYVTKSERPAEKRSITRLHIDAATGKSTYRTQDETYCNDRGKLIPTDIGFFVNEYLMQHFPDIMSYNFTADIEDQFDHIEEGNVKWNDCINTFYTLFHPLVSHAIEERTDHKVGERELGTDPTTGRVVAAKIGKYGPVVQIGTSDDKSERPLFAPLRKGMSIVTITLDEALQLFQLPRDLGEYEGETITIGEGKYGPYARHCQKYYQLPKTADPLTITLDEAIQVIENKREEDRKRVLRTFTEDPELLMLNGHYGPYLSRAGKNYKLPRHDSDKLTYEDCVRIMQEADAASEADAAKKPRRGRPKKAAKAE